MKFLIRAGKVDGEIKSSVHDYVFNTFGSNSGNLAYQCSIQRLLSNEGLNSFVATKYNHKSDEARIKEINENFDAFILPMANNIGRKNFVAQLDELSTLIEKVDIPCVVVGIGIQTSIDGNLNLPCKDNTIRFVNAVLSKSKVIGVRGQLTKDYLISIGIPSEKIEVIGCPSLYLNGEGYTVSRQCLNPARIAFSWTNGLDRDKRVIFSDYLRKFAGPIYIGQRRDELSSMLFCRENSNLQDDEFLMVNSPDCTLIRENKARFFCDYKSWIKYLSGFDLCIGTRLHGVITGILSGTPSLLLVHDSRTLELANFHKIPFIKLSEINSVEDIEARVQNLSYEEFNIQTKKNFRIFNEFMRKNGLTINDPGPLDIQSIAPQIIKPTLFEDFETQVDRFRTIGNIESNYIKRLKSKLK